jgi:3-hydroxybutyryl-CoA dehydrogenase
MRKYIENIEQSLVDYYEFSRKNGDRSEEGNRVMNIADVHRVTVVGAGTMGAGIALCFAHAGFETRLFDMASDQLERAMERIRHSQDVLIQEGVLSAIAAEQAREKITCIDSLTEALEGAQFILEAIPEDLELKQELLTEIEVCISHQSIIATNTSGLSITAIASVCSHPERIAGMHWVNPPELLPLVEIIKTEYTTEQTLNLIYDLALKLGKKPVIIHKEVPGLGLNRLQFAVFREALQMVEDGVVSPRDVDRIMKYGPGFRYPWLGPLETADLGGLDVFHSISRYLFKNLSDMKEPPKSFNELVAAGKLGIKTGQGFYEYDDSVRDDILRQRDLYFIRQWKLIGDMNRLEDET